MSIPRFLVPDLVEGAGVVDLSNEEAHHLRDVLRLHVGADVRAFDGRGHEWAGRVEQVTRAGARVRLDAELTPVAEPDVAITLAAGLLTGDQFDDVVRDATMLGVRRIVPMSTDHVSVRKRGRGPQNPQNLARWRRIAVASAKQCQRAVVPEIAALTRFPDVLEAPSVRSVMCVEPAVVGVCAMEAIGPKAASVTLLIGPEGGWSSHEVADAERAGAMLIHLGPRTLRAERAPVVALSALWTVWGW